MLGAFLYTVLVHAAVALLSRREPPAVHSRTPLPDEDTAAQLAMVLERERGNVTASRPLAREWAMQPACDAAIDADERVFLMTVVDAFHGSTALQQTLMGSESLATLCSARIWACEGRELLPNSDPGMFDVLTLYGSYWNLSKPVFFDKSPGMLKSIPRFFESQLQSHVGPNGELPPRYLQFGIQRLRLAFVAMWRPVCISQTSSHSPGNPDFEFAASEGKRLEVLVKDINWMQDLGMPYLVVSFGQLLWNPDATQRRLQNFLPCLPGVSPDYVPQMNVDIFDGNDWKAKGSVRQYGLAKDPKLVGYNVTTDRCHGDWTYPKMLQEDPDLLHNTLRNQFFLEALSK